MVIDKLISPPISYEKIELKVINEMDINQYMLFKEAYTFDVVAETSGVLMSYFQGFESPDLVRSGPLGIGLGTNFHVINITIYKKAGSVIGFGFPSMTLPVGQTIKVYTGNYDNMGALHMIEDNHSSLCVFFLYENRNIWKEQEGERNIYLYKGTDLKNAIQLVEHKIF